MGPLEEKLGTMIRNQCYKDMGLSSRGSETSCKKFGFLIQGVKSEGLSKGPGAQE